MTTQKKRKAPRAPFIVTVAAVSAVAFTAAPGCGNSVSGTCEDPNMSCNPPFPECPDALPAEGGACEEPGMSCTYPGGGGCDYGATATCDVTQGWQVHHDIADCNPPGCPAEVPEQGAPCEPPWEDACTYTVDTGCGPMDAYVSCEGGAWQVGIPTCNPPPPDYCFTLATEDECVGVSPFCRWLTPGCAEPGSLPPALSQAGCFPSFDCATSADCPDGTTCSEAVYDPCYMQSCDACGAVADLCVAP